MSERKTLIRKLVYGAFMVVLFVPLSMMSQPATKESSGGILARLRKTHKLSQAELGDIDPSSATMKLATMGMGGVAVNLLWERANEYKKKEDWIALGATLEQIVKLQPHFYKVWDFQAHNLSYNISAEFDDYHDRYTYVIRGINFLKQGFEKNDSEPRLLNRIGWYIGQKIGRADEHKQYRRLFREDWNNLFHVTDNPDRTPEERDNWLVAREKHRLAEDLADTLKSRNIYLKTTPLLFYSEAPKSQINYAETRQLEGRFLQPDERSETKRAWETARAEWREYGQRQLPTSFGIEIRLQDLENQEKLAAELTAEIEALLPGVRERLRDEKLAGFAADIREAIRTPFEHRTHDQMALAAEHEYKTAVNWDEVADQAPADQRADAKRLSNALMRAEAQVNAISTERGKVNYEYWRTRGDAESEEITLEARRLTYEAGDQMDRANVDKAIPLYEEAWKKWREVVDRYPRMAGESVSADELVEDINRYKKALSFYGQKFPQPFILQEVIDVAEMKIIYTPEQLAEMEREAERKAEQKNGDE
ncbi:MAG: hypothetical protein WD894_18725 [Pirellulales bacterium]